MRLRTLFQRLTVTLVLAASTLSASAQSGSITPGVASDTQVIDFVETRLGRLGSGDPLAVRQARIDLLAPLKAPSADSSFRLQYSGALGQGGLARLASDDDALVAINAIVIAGELATQLSASVLSAALEDDRTAIRYQAARSMGLLLRGFDSGRAAIPANQIDAVFHRIAAQFLTEPSEQVIDALIIALATPNEDPEFRSRCVRAMCDGVAVVSRRWRSGQPTEGQALTVFRAIDEAYEELLAVQGGIDHDFARSAAIASGQSLTFLVHWIETTPPVSMSPETRQLAIDLGAAAERVLLLAHSTLTGERQNERITRPLRDYIDGKPGSALAKIRGAIEIWTGHAGRLLSAPYNVSAGDFD